MFFKSKGVKQNIGRSMIEMLAVLAIIGILSVGMVAGYQYAMTSYKASRTIEDVITRATAVPAQDERFFTRSEYEEFYFAVLPERGTEGRFYPMHTKGSDNVLYGYRVIVGTNARPVSQRVCRKILSMQLSRLIVGIFVNGLEFTGDETMCSDNGNQMTFYFSPRTGSNNAANPEPVGGDDNVDNDADDSEEDTCGKIICYTGTCCNVAERVCPGDDGKCPSCTPDAACEGCEETKCKTGDCCDEETTACFYAGEKCHACSKKTGCPVECGETRPDDPATITEQECCEYWKDENEVSIWTWNSSTNTCGCPAGQEWSTSENKCIISCSATPLSDPATITLQRCCEYWKDGSNANMFVWNTTSNVCSCPEGKVWDGAAVECLTVEDCGDTPPADLASIETRYCCGHWSLVWDPATSTCGCPEGRIWNGEACVDVTGFCVYRFQWPSEPYTTMHNDDGVSWMEAKEVSYSEVVGCPSSTDCCALVWKDTACTELDSDIVNGYVYGQCMSCQNFDSRRATCPSQ